MVERDTAKKELDLEWVELIREAKKLGIEIEEIRDFINAGDFTKFEDKNH